jgi:DNA-binding NarL/FixJ family response regulator
MELSPAKLRIVLAEDHDLLRQSFVKLLARQPDFEVVGEAYDGPTAVDLARQLKPDLVLMDVSLPGMSGIEATKLIATESPEVKVIGLSMHEEDQMSATMREAGAIGYIPKHLPGPALLRAIRDLSGV